MDRMNASFVEFYRAAMRWSGDATLHFETAQGPVLPGFHVTSLTFRPESGVDCGGYTWQAKSTVLQILDGMGGPPMPVAKFQEILKRSLETIPDLAGGELEFSFGPKNSGLVAYRLADVQATESRVLILLEERTAFCSLMLNAKRQGQSDLDGKSVPRQSLSCG